MQPNPPPIVQGKHMTLEQHIHAWRQKRAMYLQQIRRLEGIVRSQRKELRQYQAPHGAAAQMADTIQRQREYIADLQRELTKHERPLRAQIAYITPVLMEGGAREERRRIMATIEGYRERQDALSARGDAYAGFSAACLGVLLEELAR